MAELGAVRTASGLALPQGAPNRVDAVVHPVQRPPLTLSMPQPSERFGTLKRSPLVFIDVFGATCFMSLAGYDGSNQSCRGTLVLGRRKKNMLHVAPTTSDRM